jgi:hypothetical protein
MELARMIAGNNRASVMGIKTLLLEQMGQKLEQQWSKEQHYRGMSSEAPRRRRRSPNSSLAEVDLSREIRGRNTARRSFSLDGRSNHANCAISR